MKISELQEHLKDRLNGVEALMQHGCKAFAEDTREVYKESNVWTNLSALTKERRRWYNMSHEGQ